MINQIQFIAYAVVFAGLVTAVYFYHFKPISDLESRVTHLEALLDRKNTTISNLDSKLRKCQEEKKQSNFESYVEGLSNEVNHTVYPKFTF